MTRPNVYNMPSGVPFLPSLAAGLKERFGDSLPQALILLPTRRAVRQLGEAFVGGESASLLPRMRTLADIDPEEPPFEPGYLTGLVKPAMPGAQRRFELAQLVARYHSAITDLPLDPAGMLALADPLLSILDDAALEEVTLADVTKLKDIEGFAAEHFENAATLYRIIQDFWPAFLKDQNLMEPMARRVALLNALTDLWGETPPQHPVIIAGSTGTLCASARLMRCVARMPNGVVVLPGLDTELPDKSWEKIDVSSPQHPQTSLKNLIEVIGIERAEVPVWPSANTLADPAEARRRIISESLVPIDSTADWPGRIMQLRKNYPGGDVFEKALQGLSVIEARTDDEEALTIALILRETLETPGQTGALVTPDPALARRVRARLRRWQVDVDYSQGEPLEETQAGSFLAGLLRLAQDPDNPVDLAFMCKHALTGLGQKPQRLRTDWAKLELEHFRGGRPSGMQAYDVLKPLYAALSEISAGADHLSAPDWAKKLALASEAFTASDVATGAEVLWRGEAGEAAAGMLEDLIDHGSTLGEMDLRSFARLVSVLMRGRVVRARYGMHPRLQILGPLEARMLQADRIILGGLNEGVWPAGLSALPFLSRGMRAALGLSLPERRYGLAAHDFAELTANPEVILTRAQRSDDSPRVASRWLWRLQALVRGAMGKDHKALNSATPYLEWARALDHVKAAEVAPTAPPAPKPALEERWPRGRKLSVTQIRTWVRDPYAIYAKEILRLVPLRELDEALGAREYGSAIHEGLETFMKRFSSGLPHDAGRQLSQDLKTALLSNGFEEHHLVKEEVRLRQAAESLCILFAQRRAEGWQYGRAENYGKVLLPEINFTLTSYADLIEKSAEGYAIIDYKTGAPATEAVVQAGFDPQLPLTALMLAKGGFDNVAAGETEQLLYIRVKGAGYGTEAKFITLPENKKGWSGPEYTEAAFANLRQLVSQFDDPDTAYPSQPRIQYVNDYGDYDHLARRGEWAQIGDEGFGS